MNIEEFYNWRENCPYCKKSLTCGVDFIYSGGTQHLTFEKTKDQLDFVFLPKSSNLSPTDKGFDNILKLNDILKLKCPNIRKYCPYYNTGTHCYYYVYNSNLIMIETIGIDNSSLRIENDYSNNKSKIYTNNQLIRRDEITNLDDLDKTIIKVQLLI